MHLIYDLPTSKTKFVILKCKLCETKTQKLYSGYFTGNHGQVTAVRAEKIQKMYVHVMLHEVYYFVQIN